MTTKTKLLIRTAAKHAGSGFFFLLLFVSVGFLWWYQDGINKQATIERHEQREYLEAIENIDGARSVADADGIIRDWNQGMTDIFGYSASEIIGLPVETLMKASDAESHHQKFVQGMSSLPSGTVIIFSCTGRRKDGSDVGLWVRLRIDRRAGAPIAITRFDELTSVVGVVRDSYEQSLAVPPTVAGGQDRIDEVLEQQQELIAMITKALEQFSIHQTINVHPHKDEQPPQADHEDQADRIILTMIQRARQERQDAVRTSSNVPRD